MSIRNFRVERVDLAQFVSMHDDIDALSVHFHLFDGAGDVAGNLRLTPPDAPHWLLDRPPLAGLVNRTLDPAYPRSRSAELSRFVVRPEIAERRDRRGFSAAQALRRAAWQHSIRAGWRYWYVIAHWAEIANLRRSDHLPLQVISGTAGGTCVACVDLAAAYSLMLTEARTFLAWNNDGLLQSDVVEALGF